MEEMSYITKVAHIGIAVPDIEEAQRLYARLGYKAEGKATAVANHGVNALMMRNGSLEIELLSPLEKGKPSPIDTYIATKPYKMYHIAYYVSDFEAQIAELQKNRYVMIDEPAESETQQGKRTVFLFHRRLGIIELVEEMG